MKAIRTVLACIRKADQKYNLINHGDKIVIGLSGGKDSMLLCYTLALYQKFSHTDFQIQPVTLDLGFPGFNPDKLYKFCESIGLSLIVHDGREVYPILEKNKGDKKHLPCSICSKMKKALINEVANKLGYNKVAFAHHADDAVETLFMNEIYGGRIATFSPKMTLERAGITFIRPLILVHEKDIIQTMKEEGLEAVSSKCPADKYTTREDIKNILKDIKSRYPMSKDNFVTMLDNYTKMAVWGEEIQLKVNQDNMYLTPVTTPYQASLMHDIRYNVFVKEQGISYEDEFVIEEEKTANNYLIYKDDIAIGTIRYLQTDEGIRIGRFAILLDYRGRGYGKEVIKFFAHYLWCIYNPQIIIVNSMEYIANLYLSQGFISTDIKSIEAGIPHIKLIYKEGKK